jgi:hypothetical protein
VVTGKSDSKCGLPMPRCAAQLSREIHVVTDAEGSGFGAMAGDRLNLTTGATGLGDREVNGL